MFNFGEASFDDLIEDEFLTTSTAKILFNKKAFAIQSLKAAFIRLLLCQFLQFSQM
jgi:hypothetical protein